jgi:hypothetical protein
MSAQRGGSVTCNSRMVSSAVFGDGKPTEVSTSSNSSLVHRERTRSSDSHTTDQVQGTFADRAVVAQLSHASRTPATHDQRMRPPYACLNWSTSPSKRAINMTATATPLSPTVTTDCAT